MTGKVDGKVDIINKIGSASIRAEATRGNYTRVVQEYPEIFEELVRNGYADQSTLPHLRPYESVFTYKPPGSDPKKSDKSSKDNKTIESPSLSRGIDA